MTAHEVKEMMEELSIPTSYFKFDEGRTVQPPFAVWYFGESNDVYADDRNYVPISSLVIELYTDEIDLEIQQEIQNLLTEHELPYIRTEPNYIEEELLYEVDFETEVQIDA